MNESNPVSIGLFIMILRVLSIPTFALAALIGLSLGIMGGGFPPTPEGFMGFLDSRGLSPTPTCKDQMGTESPFARPSERAATEIRPSERQPVPVRPSLERPSYGETDLDIPSFLRRKQD